MRIMAPQRKGPTLSAGEDALIAVLLADSFTQVLQDCFQEVVIAS